MCTAVKAAEWIEVFEIHRCYAFEKVQRHTAVAADGDQGCSDASRTCDPFRPRQLAWSRPHRDADSMVAGTRIAKCERICSGLYIHGTPEEWTIGSPASDGYIRMRSSDIIQLYNIVGIGAAVTIVNASLVSAIPGMASGHSMGPENTAPFVMR